MTVFSLCFPVFLPRHSEAATCLCSRFEGNNLLEPAKHAQGWHLSATAFATPHNPFGPRCTCMDLQTVSATGNLLAFEVDGLVLASPRLPSKQDTRSSDLMVIECRYITAEYKLKTHDSRNCGKHTGRKRVRKSCSGSDPPCCKRSRVSKVGRSQKNWRMHPSRAYQALTAKTCNDIATTFWGQVGLGRSCERALEGKRGSM